MIRAGKPFAVSTLKKRGKIPQLLPISLIFTPIMILKTSFDEINICNEMYISYNMYNITG